MASMGDIGAWAGAGVLACGCLSQDAAKAKKGRLMRAAMRSAACMGDSKVRCIIGMREVVRVCTNRTQMGSRVRFVPRRD